jgi:hypothetical protein
MLMVASRLVYEVGSLTKTMHLEVGMSNQVFRNLTCKVKLTEDTTTIVLHLWRTHVDFSSRPLSK